MAFECQPVSARNPVYWGCSIVCQKSILGAQLVTRNQGLEDCRLGAPRLEGEAPMPNDGFLHRKCGKTYTFPMLAPSSVKGCLPRLGATTRRTR